MAIRRSASAFRTSSRPSVNPGRQVPTSSSNTSRAAQPPHPVQPVGRLWRRPVPLVSGSSALPTTSAFSGSDHPRKSCRSASARTPTSATVIARRFRRLPLRPRNGIPLNVLRRYTLYRATIVCAKAVTTVHRIRATLPRTMRANASAGMASSAHLRIWHKAHRRATPSEGCAAESPGAPPGQWLYRGWRFAEALRDVLFSSSMPLCSRETARKREDIVRRAVRTVGCRSPAKFGETTTSGSAANREAVRQFYRVRSLS